ncbi:MAG TPA: prolyl oligopeptidase family serine peptidase, partial [Bdellovibrionales bacterium]|nr:prolyl oligopeptidase family serine peptidase [Bdellovibrionales bacterium]
LREVPGRPESRNSICAIDLKTGQIQDLVTGADFDNCARLKGDKLLWISWNHPNMPWNGTELFTADLSDLKNPIKIAGDREHAISQARWSPDDDDIYFVGEFTDFARLHRHRAGRIEVVFDIPAEFGLPDWVPGQQLYDFVGSAVVAAHAVNGRWQMVIRDGNGQPRRLGPTYALIGAIRAQGARIVAMVTHSDKPATLIAVSQAGEIESLFEGTAARLDSGYLSIGEELRYPVENGGEGYAWFYPPKNAEFEGPKTERPPLVVMAHGGPTAMSFASYNKSIQFWTSRGFAVVDVNYGGSTGYGRKYRERLRDNWGVVDVGDCAAAVRTLGARGLIDPKRVAIRGGSAGGYTTLAALAFTKDVFAVGASYYGVSDLELLAKETHKFESRYLDQLVGPYPSAIQVYRERAPRAHIEKFDCPIVFFQGGEDKVVLPNQAELMYESLKVKGITTEYHLYPKEGHGFVDAKNVQHSLKTELAFYAKVFGVNGFELDAKRV